MITSQELVLELGLRRSGHTWVGTCPACGYDDAFSVTEKDCTTLFYCHSCQDSPAIVAELKRAQAWNGVTKQASHVWAKAIPAQKPDAWRSLWERSVQSKGTLAEVYLQFRRLNNLVCPDIRFLPDCYHKDSNQSFPVMLSGVRAVNGELIAVHRTYLRSDGQGKAPVLKPKMSLGSIKGGAIRLAEAGSTLGISEGIETGLAFQQETGIPVWAAIACGIMPDMVLPALPQAKEVIIAADPDPVGMKFAKRAAQKWTAQGRIVRIAVPPIPNKDFADLLTIQE